MANDYCSVCGNPGGTVILNDRREICHVHLGTCKAKFMLTLTKISEEDRAVAEDCLRVQRENSLTIKFKKLHPDAKIPTRATEFAAGFDISTIEFWKLQPGERHLFSTGLASRIPHGFCVVLFDRSGMGAKKNIHRLAGVIDEDYRGVWLVCLVNLSDNAHQINAGDNIIQGLVLPVPQVSIIEVSSLDETVRGSKGFGQLSGD